MNPAAPLPNDPKTLVQQGRQFFANREYAKALPLFQQALELTPPNTPQQTHARAYNVGRCYQEIGQHHQALTFLADAVFDSLLCYESQVMKLPFNIMEVRKRLVEDGPGPFLAMIRTMEFYASIVKDKWFLRDAAKVEKVKEAVQKFGNTPGKDMMAMCLHKEDMSTMIGQIAKYTLALVSSLQQVGKLYNAIILIEAIANISAWTSEDKAAQATIINFQAKAVELQSHLQNQDATSNPLEKILAIGPLDAEINSVVETLTALSITNPTVTSLEVADETTIAKIFQRWDNHIPEVQQQHAALKPFKVFLGTLSDHCRVQIDISDYRQAKLKVEKLAYTSSKALLLKFSGENNYSQSNKEDAAKAAIEYARVYAASLRCHGEFPEAQKVLHQILFLLSSNFIFNNVHLQGQKTLQEEMQYSEYGNQLISWNNGTGAAPSGLESFEIYLQKEPYNFTFRLLLIRLYVASNDQERIIHHFNMLFVDILGKPDKPYPQTSQEYAFCVNTVMSLFTNSSLLQHYFFHQLYQSYYIALSESSKPDAETVIISAREFLVQHYPDIIESDYLEILYLKNSPMMSPDIQNNPHPHLSYALFLWRQSRHGEAKSQWNVAQELLLKNPATSPETLDLARQLSLIMNVPLQSMPVSNNTTEFRFTEAMNQFRATFSASVSKTWGQIINSLVPSGQNRDNADVELLQLASKSGPT